MGLRIIICGGREYADVPRLFGVLDKLDEMTRDSHGGVDTVVEGASYAVSGRYKGADYWGRVWATCRGKEVVTVPAKWAKFGNGAGPIRNRSMLHDHGPIDAVVAFPGGKGTADMVKQARDFGVKVYVIDEELWEVKP